MKKIFLAVLAVATLASCATDEIVSTPKGAAIGFDEAFVDNSTRANDITSANIANFSVYGSVVKGGQQGLIFNNQKVVKNGTAYEYSPAQYWIAAANYYFVAIAPYSDVWGYTPTDNLAQNGTITLDNSASGANANVDLLYAYNAPTKTPDEITSQPDPVAFTFKHLLSRVKFTFHNKFNAGSNIELVVSGVKVNNVFQSGSLAVTNGQVETWDVTGVAIDEFVFGNVNETASQAADPTKIADNNGYASTEYFYFIPAEATYEVEFDVNLWQAGVSVDTYHHTVNVPAKLEMGRSYNIVAELAPGNVSDDPTNTVYPIEFTVTEVEEWVTDEKPETTVPTPGYPAQGNN